MNKGLNIFIEGIPGSGKTTLLGRFSEHLKNYNFYREGDVSPVELAWCSYMTKEQYEQTISDFPDFQEDINKLTIKEGNYFIVAYTNIRTENIELYSYMERYEIYGGRRTISEFKDIIINRFSNFKQYGNVFECSFFQNIIEELMLFAMYDDRQILDFYTDMVACIDTSRFVMLRLLSPNLEDSILKIKKERVNEKGEEIWYQLMMDYFKQSPYGKLHQHFDFNDLVSHFNRRIMIENKVINDLLKNKCINLESKAYDLQYVLNLIRHDSVLKG